MALKRLETDPERPYPELSIRRAGSVIGRRAPLALEFQT